MDVVIHTAIAIILVVLLIIRFKVDPMISLIIGCFYLGLAGGVGLTGTVDAVTFGFGDIMISVGLLIGFGVLIGSLLHAAGTFTKLVRLLLRMGERRLPYAMTTALAAVFPSIYVDVQVVLASPIARSAAPALGRFGLAQMSGAIGIGIFAGYVFVVPGLAAVSIAGLLGVPLGSWLGWGLALGPLTAILTTIIFSATMRWFWRPEKDEDQDGPEPIEEAPAPDEPYQRGQVSLGVGLLPILVPLVMIGFGAFASTFGLVDPEAEYSSWSLTDVVLFIGEPNVALFVGLLLAYLIARTTLGSNHTNEALSSGFHTSGEILLITGVGGSLGEVIDRTGMGEVLASVFSADEGASTIVTILLAWLVAAVLHLAIGSVSVAAIAAAGVIAPVLGSLGVAPLAIGLAIASGAMFAVHVNSNFFWMFRSLLGLTTSGALKSMTLVTSVGAVVSLPLVVALAFVL